MLWRLLWFLIIGVLVFIIVLKIRSVWMEEGRKAKRIERKQAFEDAVENKHLNETLKEQAEKENKVGSGSEARQDVNEFINENR